MKVYIWLLHKHIFSTIEGNLEIHTNHFIAKEYREKVEEFWLFIYFYDILHFMSQRNKRRALENISTYIQGLLILCHDKTS